jgi:hypothetical protein
MVIGISTNAFAGACCKKHDFEDTYFPVDSYSNYFFFVGLDPRLCEDDNDIMFETGKYVFSVN